MHAHKLPAILLAFVALLTVQVAKAQDLSDQDRHFVFDAHSAGMLEVRLGQFAVQNSPNDAVRHFAQHMIDDHTAADDHLKSIASDHGVFVPHDLKDEDRHVLDRLERLSGPDFDRAYAAQMVRDHEKAIELFEQERDSGSIPALRHFAEETLPTLHHHLDMAKELDHRLNNG